MTINNKICTHATQPRPPCAHLCNIRLFEQGHGVSQAGPYVVAGPRMSEGERQKKIEGAKKLRVLERDYWNVVDGRAEEMEVMQTESTPTFRDVG